MAARYGPPLPDIFAQVFSDLEEQRYTDSTPFHNCFGCGPNHEIGLRVRWFKTDQGVLSPIIIPKRFEGPPGVAHGGIVAGYLDEVLAGAAVRRGGRACFTGELTVRYVKPVPVETPLLGGGRLLRDHGKYLDVEGSLQDYQSRAALAEARGRFFPVRAASS
ncbi:MAG: PaaI family thioesterase [Candidatus Methylomirabilia bacterium]